MNDNDRQATDVALDPWRTARIECAPRGHSVSSDELLDDEDSWRRLAIPGCDVLGELGRGGMGQVVRVRDAQMDRGLAVKLMLRPYAEKSEFVERFFFEARITGQLQHPGIPPVHAIGRLEDGRPYFSMKLIEGRTLSELLRNRPDSRADLPKLLVIFQQVCQALAYAHAEGVIHRDVKPHNVMVGRFGEVQVMDWGFARRMDVAAANRSHALRGDDRAARQESRARLVDPNERTTQVYGASDVSGQDTDAHRLTRAGDVFGTLAYMPPEQARGWVDQLDERADVFSLGAMLCEILTGRPPYVAGDARTLYDRAAGADLADCFTRLDACRADLELVALAKRCLSPEPSQRSANAGVFVAELAAYLESVEARLRQAELDRAAALVEAREQRRRRKLTLGLATAVVLVLALLGGAALWLQSHRAQTEREAGQALVTAGQLLEQARSMPADDARQAAAAIFVLRQANSAVEGANSVLAAGMAGEGQRSATAELAIEIDVVLQRLEREESLFRDLEAARMAKAAWLQPPWQAGSRPSPEFQTANSSGTANFVASTQAYALALERFGCGSVQNKDEVARHIRGQRNAVRRALISAVDDWAWDALRCEQLELSTAVSSHDLRLLAQAADDDAWAKRWRQAVLDGDAAALLQAAADGRSRERPGSALLPLAAALPRGSVDQLALLRHARQQQPDDFWVHYTLGHILWLSARDAAAVQEMIGCYRTVIALRPDCAAGHSDLGMALLAAGDVAGAIVELRKALGIDPRLANAHCGLGRALLESTELAAAISARGTGVMAGSHQPVNISPPRPDDEVSARAREAVQSLQRAADIDPSFAVPWGHLGVAFFVIGRNDDAIDALRTAVGLAPKDALARSNFATVLLAGGQVDAAIAESRAALDVNPRLAIAHSCLGDALFHLGRIDEAIAAYRQAIEIGPADAGMYNGLGIALCTQGNLKEGIAILRQAISSNPRNAEAHNNLAAALMQSGDLDGALDASRRAVEIAPASPHFHFTLGLILAAKAQTDDAIQALHKTVELAPRYSRGHGALAQELAKKGDFVAARDHTRIGLDALPPQDPLQAAMRRQLELYEWKALEALLPDVLSGKTEPADNAQRLDFVKLCTKQYRLAAAVRYYSEAFRADPQVAEDQVQGHRYKAAYCAVVASSGIGVDAAALDDEARAALRKQALEWLTADLAARRKQLNGEVTAQTEQVREPLLSWQKINVLDAARDAKLLEKLPLEEQPAWREFWADVAAVIEESKPKP